MKSPLKILHFESISFEAAAIKEIIKKGNFTFEYFWVKNSVEFEHELLRFNPDLILCNFSLLPPRLKKKLLQVTDKDTHAPLLLIAGEYSEATENEMIKSSAQDYFFKDRLQRLPKAILNLVDKSNAEKSPRGQHAEVSGTENRFRTLTESSSDAILLLDSRGIITYQSPSTERISGFHSKESVGKSIFEFIHPGDLKDLTRALKQAILTPGHSLNNSYRIQQKAGSFIWLEGTMTNLLHDQNIKSIIVNYRDVTARKSFDERLQSSEANLRTIFDNTKVSYLFADKNYTLLSFNATAASTYGKEFKVLLKEGDSLLDYLSEDQKVIARERFEKALCGDKVSYDLSFVQPFGNTTWYNVNMFAVRDDKDKLLGFIISSEDITLRKNIELERNKMLSDILQHNKDLEQFAYIISHNLRSPVANILGLSALLENSAEMDKPTFEKCMNGLTLSVKKLDEVIVDLNYILQTRREINEKKEVVSFSGLINDIKTSISSLIEKEGVTINTNFTVNKFSTLKSYLYSIFFNLIYNSIKYRNPATPLVINIQGQLVNNKLVLEFRDNGLGIDLNAHGNKIFGLYKKFHKHVEGKGMGLYMVKTQVEILGGRIYVASEVNKGTTFTIEFEH